MSLNCCIDLQAASGPIVVFGEALVDDLGATQVIGGAPFNVARHLAAFGQGPTMVTRVGNDPHGIAIREQFQHFGMSQRALQFDDSAPTGRVLVERAGGAQRSVVLPNQAYDQISAQAMEDAIDGDPASTIYFSTLAQRAARSRVALQRLLIVEPARRYLDLNMLEGQVSERVVFESLHYADIVKVNEDELHELLQRFLHRRPLPEAGDSPGLGAACAGLLRLFSLAGLIVTLGARGSVYYGPDGQVIRSPARDGVDVVDPAGAGDAFSAMFLLGEARGWPLGQTLARANEFAAAVCAMADAVPVDLGFYARWQARWLEH